MAYCRYDRRYSPQTVYTYERAITRFISVAGDGDVSGLTPHHFLEAKRQLFEQGLGESRVAGVIFAMRSLLKYCREVMGVPVVDPALIRPPRPPRRDVVYLTKEEVEQFMEAIPSHGAYGLRFRTFCEVLLGTAMRLSEALSLDREQIDLYRREAKIVGKGNKERTVFFTERSLEWIERYIAARTDNHPALFVTFATRRTLDRLKRDDIQESFKVYRARADLRKKVTPHILRHTAATLLLFNGCPISHVKEILGHERLETTCKYYLGLDRKEAKAAHEQFMQL